MIPPTWRLSAGLWPAAPAGCKKCEGKNMKLSGYRYLCQKNEEENYLLDKLIFRRISIFLTIILIKFRIRPNQATLLSLLASLASLYFLTFNSRREMLIAAFLILLYYLFDHSTATGRYYQQMEVMRQSCRPVF